MPDFLFVPGRSSAKTYVEKVRSHVARSQHAVLSTKSAAAPRAAEKRRRRRRVKVAGQPFDSLDFRVITGDPSTPAQPNTPNAALTKSSSSSSSSSTDSSSIDLSRGSLAPLDEPCYDADDSCTALQRREPLHPVLASTPLLEITFMPFIIHFYLTNMAVEIPAIDADCPGSLRYIWFPFALGNPAIMRAIILTAGSLFANKAPLPPADRKFVRRQLLEVKQATIEEIQILLTNPETALGDAAVAAVLKLASYEAMFGSEASYIHHMEGLAQMVSMRGGTETLGLDGVLRRMLYWVDSNAAFLLGRRPFFLEEGRPELPFDAANFIGES